MVSCGCVKNHSKLVWFVWVDETVMRQVPNFAFHCCALIGAYLSGVTIAYELLNKLSITVGVVRIPATPFFVAE